MNFDVKTEKLSDGQYVISLAGEVDLYPWPCTDPRVADQVARVPQVEGEVGRAQGEEVVGLAGAALDVYEKEPEIHAGLMALENVLLIPHLASATTETRTAMADLAVTNAIAVLNGQPPVTPVP